MYFKELELSDRNRLNTYYYANKCRSCDNTFADIFCWRDMFSTQWTELDSFLIVRFMYRSDGWYYYMMPLGLNPQADCSTVLSALVDEARKDDMPLRMMGLTKNDEKRVESIMPGEFIFDTDPADRDYIYLSEDLRNLSGEKYASKRNHINRFLAMYDYQYLPLERDKFDECLRLAEEWCRRRGGCKQKLEAEQDAMRIAFDNFEALGLFGGTLWVDGKLVAFTYGSAVCEDVFCTHVEKADTDYEGAYTMINKLLAEHLPKQYVYINREEDMGIEGLRKAKMSYHPVELCENACALHLDDNMRDIKHIWKECFGDDDNFINSFLVRYYSPVSTFVRCHNGHAVSMVHAVPFESNVGRTAYIYAVATLDEYRRNGYAAELVKEALNSCRDNGFDAAILIPQNEGMIKYYERIGFENVSLPIRFNVDFDFGTGFPEADKAMVYWLKERTEESILPKELVCSPAR